ncbi:WD repeat-containing protein slp1 [Amanita muscaria]
MPQPQPKTPARNRARSETKTPLTPSVINGLNNLCLAPSPQKRPGQRTKTKSISGSYDLTNPFIVPPSFKSNSRPPSRPSSPIKRTTSSGIPLSEAFQRQANGGVIRKGGVESRLDVVTRDYVPPPKPEIKRSKSTPAVNKIGGDKRDRFITNRDPASSNIDLHSVASTLEHLSNPPTSSTSSGTNSTNYSPGHTARLAAATGVPLNRRILGYHEQPPAASSSTVTLAADTALAQQREFAKPLYAPRPGTLPNSVGSMTSKARKIPTQPERVLDAPGLVDDFYLNLLSWSAQNTVAVALEGATYIWRADTGSVSQLSDVSSLGTFVSSVDFSNDGSFLAAGLDSGDIELWDIESGQKLRTMSGHQAQVGTLSWHGHILSSGCADGSIWHHDVRVSRHKVMELIGHTGGICGMKWRSDGELLASGGNDNVVNIWDGRVGDVNPAEGARGSAKWTKRNHTAAVKALAWCPWHPALLATGGGTNDATINIWNSTTGARLHTVKTPAQITSLIFAPHKKELMSTHGYPTNAIMIHAYPSMDRVAEIRDAHDTRVLYSCVSTAGDVVCTGAGDENLKFWRLWDTGGEGGGKKRKGAIEDLGGGVRNSTKGGILSIR